ncbi:polar amino acid ABC transporter permease [Sphaerisporangium krabiense]|uniref:Polar amino acid transport system permease protein n=1 Tax=Sphaerisporangium krabiense TaxID=763782 RepID=A0A7W8Z048_9ACTN|nr:amino acid ABC transporter permease [Sphaerisporangium krabiense]MBB5625017.1 polar amino acid transport system permease protein [Sphaerisporangium krabiense]GII66943.1 polar amino acid ABC transporter permease [Sphaerisporangium krabiense]
MTVRTEPITGASGTPVPVVRTWHWGRWLAGAVALAVVGWLVYLLVVNPHLNWGKVAEYLFNGRILDGVWVTIEISVLATVLGLVLGVLIAIMRLSHNPVLSKLATFYIWFFRGTPVLVQLIFWYNLAFLFPELVLKIPFTSIGLKWDTNEVMTGFTSAMLGLGLNLAAYFAETVRAGIQAVDHGQTEAAYALGMTPAKRMRVIVLPQALRIIIPPTGNEFISMLKTTSLVYVVAGHDLMTNASQIYKANNLIMELLIVASLWYMLMTAVATFLQSRLERRFGAEAVRLVRGGGLAARFMPKVAA